MYSQAQTGKTNYSQVQPGTARCIQAETQNVTDMQKEAEMQKVADMQKVAEMQKVTDMQKSGRHICTTFPPGMANCSVLLTLRS